MILAVGVGWRYAPPEARERLLGFVGMAKNRADPVRVAQDIKEKIIPKDPAAHRAALVSALKQKIQEIKTDAGVGENADGTGAPAGAPTNASAPSVRAAAIAKAADEAVQLADQVAQAGGAASTGGQIIQHLLERILPVPECKQ